jgi:hypothetical protein
MHEAESNTFLVEVSTDVFLIVHRSLDHHATYTALTLWPTHDRVTSTLRTRRRSEQSRTPSRTTRIRIKTVSRNPFCKIRINFIDLELKLEIESA